jgi:NAD(P)-dependent dehydrogenase (short-subunit alcohol dehydrogenase family)
VSAFTDKTVVVTGASSGIGRALCLELAGERPRLVLAARDAARLAEVALACEERGAQALAVPTDVTSETDCRALVDKTLERFGSVDALVVNAGITMWSRFDEMRDLSLYEKLYRVNVLGAIYPTFYALPALKQARGRIAAVSSLAGLTGVPERTGYAATKHALFGFFESLRIELAGTGVSVTIAAPDFVVSEIHRRAIGPDGKPLGESPMLEDKIMTAEECARGISRAMARRRRLWIGSARGRLLRPVRTLLPGVVDRLTARALNRRRARSAHPRSP